MIPVTTWVWGKGTEYELGNDDISNQYSPIKNTLAFPTKVCGGFQHSLALDRDGNVWMWGKVGSGDTYGTTPGQVSYDMVDISSGGVSAGDFDLALKSNGIVYSFGYNANGQLGDGSNSDNYSGFGFVPVQGHRVLLIAAGASHSLVFAEDGNLYSWGLNSSGQLGLGNTSGGSGNYSASRITGDYAPAQIVAKGNSSYVRTVTGYIYAWGANGRGQLGNGNNSNQTSPVLISSTLKFTYLSAGKVHALAIDGGGHVWSWGHNANGQLGDGTTTGRNTPAQISGISNVVQVEGGDDFSVALDSDGNVWTWGRNNVGQLGTGNTTPSLVPVKIGKFGDIISIGAGSAHVLAIKSNVGKYGMPPFNNPYDPEEVDTPDIDFGHVLDTKAIQVTRRGDDGSMVWTPPKGCNIVNQYALLNRVKRGSIDGTLHVAGDGTTMREIL